MQPSLDVENHQSFYEHDPHAMASPEEINRREDLEKRLFSAVGRHIRLLEDDELLDWIMELEAPIVA